MLVGRCKHLERDVSRPDSTPRPVRADDDHVMLGGHIFNVRILSRVERDCHKNIPREEGGTFNPQLSKLESDAQLVANRFDVFYALARGVEDSGGTGGPHRADGGSGHPDNLRVFWELSQLGS